MARVREDYLTARICASVRNTVVRRGRGARARDYMIDLPNETGGPKQVTDGKLTGPSPDAVLAAFRAMGVRIVDKSTPAPPQPVAQPAPEADDDAAHFKTLGDN